jgi:protein-S-isoprenylcysteine O-methyltransferase Ste14
MTKLLHSLTMALVIVGAHAWMASPPLQSARPFSLALHMSSPNSKRKAGSSSTTGSSTDSPTSGSNNFSFSSDLSLDSVTKALDLDKLQKSTASVRASLMEGEWGTRGESFVAAQFALLACILFGGVPIVGDLMLLILGPGFLLLGITVLGLGVTELGDSLSPWPVVSKSNTGLKTDGIFGQVRHPLYAGLLCASAGWSILTGSALRLLLTGVLLYVLDAKSEFEERELARKFTDYDAYKLKVQGKFFPHEIVELLPWNKKY